MRYKKIGDTKVPAIGQGTGHIHNQKIIEFGIEHGLTLIDTAESYDNEEIIGKAIKGQRENVFISTKFSPEHNSYKGVIKACEDSLKRLGTDYIDLYSMYYPNPKIDSNETLRALAHLQESGKIKYYGVCNTNRPEDYIDFAKNYCIDSVQLEYNLFDRTVEQEVLPYCEENGIAFMAYSPLLDWDLLPPERMAWAQELGMKYKGYTIQQIILNWIISHKPVVAIPRASKQKHILANATAADFMMSPEDIEFIDRIFQSDIKEIPLKQINISHNADKWPQTRREARSWKHWVVKPQDVDLADFKPIKVRWTAYNDYEILEGALRYWAWVIQKNEPIPAIVKNRNIMDFKNA